MTWEASHASTSDRRYRIFARESLTNGMPSARERMRRTDSSEQCSMRCRSLVVRRSSGDGLAGVIEEEGAAEAAGAGTCDMTDSSTTQKATAEGGTAGDGVQ